MAGDLRPVSPDGRVMVPCSLSAFSDAVSNHSQDLGKVIEKCQSWLTSGYDQIFLPPHLAHVISEGIFSQEHVADVIEASSKGEFGLHVP
ncbi:MAG: hypothetical protein R3E13_03635 [Alphaproteobacteria bacterium]